MGKYANQYFEHVEAMLQQVKESQMAKIEEAADAFVQSIKNGGAIYAFGASHAGIIAEEMFYRTGGLALINPIFNPTLMLNTKPVTLTSQVERVEDFGKVMFDSVNAKKGDTILIHSVSGRNAAAIDMALAAKEAGVTVIALTNMTYSSQVTSRHTSGKKLYEIADIVIDNQGDFEDAAIQVEGMEQKTGPTSTVTGAAIANAIVIETVEKLIESDVIPPIFHSANVDGGDEFNKRIINEYKDRITYI